MPAHPQYVKVPRARRGSVLVLCAFLMVFFLGLIAFAVDLGFIASLRTDAQRATDSAAMAAAGALVNGTSAATTTGLNYLALNSIGGKAIASSDATIEFGNWDTTAMTFTVTNNTPNAVRVTVNSGNQPLFFGKVFGRSTTSATAQSIAVYQPRDVSMVLDYSGSMCFDSQFKNISLLGQTEIEANLQQIYTQLGSPTYGSMQFDPVNYGNSSSSNSKVLKHFGLDKVAYPYPGGSWSEYVDYVQTDGYVAAAGYQNCYGYMTWINYMLAYQNTHADTPPLYGVSEQPVTALKDAVDVFLSYLTANSTDDRVSLSIYTYSDSTAILEQSLTKTYSSISSICRNRQAGHYIGGTNISAGMNKGRIDLQNNGRSGALKMMVLMTDGVVNLPTGNTNSDKAAVITEANACAAAKIPVVCISVGALADTDLMQQVADITGGVAFVVPGGQPISAVQSQLQAVFAQVAADRPLKLVK